MTMLGFNIEEFEYRESKLFSIREEFSNKMGIVTGIF